MTLREISPWKWGGLRRLEPEGRPFEGIRRQMDSLFQDMDRIFEDMSSESIGRSLLQQPWGQQDQLVPELNQTEDDKAYSISIELPGMDEKDVDVTLSGRLLTIRGEKKADEKEEGKDFYRRERLYGRFRRTLELPGEVDESKIEASFKKGVLRIELPRTKEAQAKIRHINVKAA